MRQVRGGRASCPWVYVAEFGRLGRKIRLETRRGDEELISFSPDADGGARVTRVCHEPGSVLH